jgi:hypothetical protein
MVESFSIFSTTLSVPELALILSTEGTSSATKSEFIKHQELNSSRKEVNMLDTINNSHSLLQEE